MDDKNITNIITALDDAKSDVQPDADFEKTFASLPPPPPQHRQKRSKAWMIMLLICLGCATLGAGLGAGYAAVRHFLHDSGVVSPEGGTGVTTLRLNPAAIPINPQDPSFVDVIPRVKDSVVSINVTSSVNRPFGMRDAPGAGSGFIFHEDGEYVFIATNNHVIEDAHTVTISLDDNENVAAAVIGTDRYSDLAVLAVDKNELLQKGIPFTVAEFGNSDIMRMGDTVVAIGNSMGEGQIVTKGIISATNMQIIIEDPGMRSSLTLDVMQTDAAVNRGNSGGPLVNRHGEVIGVVTAKLFGANIEGMGYALPINDAGIILAELKETGSVRQAWIGIDHLPIDEALREMFNLASTGVLIRGVLPGTPAEYAGLMTHDLIVYFDGRRLVGRDDFRAAILASRPGDTVILGVYRDRERIDVEITLGSVMP